MQFFDEINASSTDGSYETTSIDARTSSYTENALLPIRGLSPLEGERDEGSCPSSRDGLTSTQHRNLTRKFDILLQLVVWLCYLSHLEFENNFSIYRQMPSLPELRMIPIIWPWFAVAAVHIVEPQWILAVSMFLMGMLSSAMYMADPGGILSGTYDSQKFDPGESDSKMLSLQQRGFLWVIAVISSIIPPTILILLLEFYGAKARSFRFFASATGAPLGSLLAIFLLPVGNLNSETPDPHVSIGDKTARLQGLGVGILSLGIISLLEQKDHASIDSIILIKSLDHWSWENRNGWELLGQIIKFLADPQICFFVVFSIFHGLTHGLPYGVKFECKNQTLQAYFYAMPLLWSLLFVLVSWRIHNSRVALLFASVFPKVVQHVFIARTYNYHGSTKKCFIISENVWLGIGETEGLTVICLGILIIANICGKTRRTFVVGVVFSGYAAGWAVRLTTFRILIAFMVLKILSLTCYAAWLWRQNRERRKVVTGMGHFEDEAMVLNEITEFQDKTDIENINFRYSY